MMDHTKFFCSLCEKGFPNYQTELSEDQGGEQYPEIPDGPIPPQNILHLMRERHYGIKYSIIGPLIPGKTETIEIYNKREFGRKAFDPLKTSLTFHVK